MQLSEAPPRSCTWCGREKMVRPGGVLMCDNCDRPKGERITREDKERTWKGPGGRP